MFRKQTKICDFLDVISTVSKNELKMIWLSRNTKVLDSFSPQKWGTPVLCDQVTQCSSSLTFNLVSATSMMSPSFEAKELPISHNCTGP